MGIHSHWTASGFMSHCIVIGCLLSEITLVSGCCELAVQMYTWTGTRIEVSIIGPRVTFYSFIVAFFGKEE